MGDTQGGSYCAPIEQKSKNTLATLLKEGHIKSQKQKQVGWVRQSSVQTSDAD
jgi:hypothetical protein